MKTYKQIGTEIAEKLQTYGPYVVENNSSWVYYTSMSGFYQNGYYAVTVYEMTDGTKKIEVVWTTHNPNLIGELVKAIAGDEPVEISIKKPVEYETVVI